MNEKRFYVETAVFISISIFILSFCFWKFGNKEKVVGVAVEETGLEESMMTEFEKVCMNPENNLREEAAFKQNIELKKEMFIEVPLICQYPTLPTGCEATSATMVLQYYGSEISAEEFAEQWLECSDEFYSDEGVLYGPDPNEIFVGSPFFEYGFGCFAPVIANAVNNNSDIYKAEVITDVDLETLCALYIAQERPLLIWATMGMDAIFDGDSWTLEDGTYYTWIAGEHCLVLVGYDEEYYYFNDPMYGSTVSYEKTLVEARFEEVGMQAVYIYQNE